MPEKTSVFTDPAFYVAVVALGNSIFQTVSAKKNTQKSERRAKFIEGISVEFGKIESSLDSLESQIAKARKEASIGSSDILPFAISAMRTTNRSILKISEFDSVNSGLIVTSKLDELDEIIKLAEEDRFDGEFRMLSLTTAEQIVQRVNRYCMDLNRDIQRCHV